jgi:hypothetical protein
MLRFPSMREVLATCLLAAALAGCGGRTDLAEGRAADASGGSSGAGGPRGAGGAPGAGGAVVASGGTSETDDACKLRDLGSTLGIPAVEGVLAGVSSYSSSSCGRKGPDAWFRWTAPFTGDWSFDADGSDGPVTVALFYDDKGCNRSSGEACENYGSAIYGAHVVKGQTITVLADTELPTTGYTLNISGPIGEGGECHSVDVGSALGVVRVGRFVDDALYPTTLQCSGNFSATLVTSWTAPTSAYFTFDTAGSNLDTLLEVRDGCDYSHIYGCSDDYMGTDAKLTLFFSEGARVNVILGGKAATRPPDARYELSIHENVDR